MKKSTFLVFLAWTVVISYAKVIELDIQSPEIENLFDISCDYAELPADFTNFGTACEINEGDVAAIGESYLGFWNPCQEERELGYYGGMFPSPQSITARVYWNDTQGTTSFKLTGKTSPLTSQNDTKLVKEFQLEKPGWNEFVVDTSAHVEELFVYTFVITRTDNLDTILIDKVTVELGDDLPESTTEASSNTTPSIIEDGIVTLDDVNDLFPEWSSEDDEERECVYTHDLIDFANAWGCPANLEEDGIGTEGTAGYWSPCSQTNCSFIFDARSLPQIGFIAIQAYLKGLGAELIISGKESLAVPDFTELHRVIGTDEGVVFRPIGYSLTPGSPLKHFKFTLVSNGNGYSVLDKILLAQEEINLPNPSTVTPPEETSTPLVETTPSSTPEETSTTSAESGASSPFSSQLAVGFILAPIVLKYFLY